MTFQFPITNGGAHSPHSIGRWGIGLSVLMLTGSWSNAALAQAAAPVTITPPTLAPERHAQDFRISLPQGGALVPPHGAETLSITPGSVVVDGAFREVAAQTDAIIAGIAGHRVSLAQIYAAASAIEAAHARAGYVFARVSVPPQDLRDGGPLRIVVLDGFIESLDVSALPKRVRAPVLRAAAKLVNRPHLRMREVEEALMLASDTPGLTLRSTLVRGDKPGGTRLVLEGTQTPVSADLGADNAYDPSLGSYGFHAELTLNSLLGFGEQIYGFLASGYDLSRGFSGTAPASIVGGGVTLPLGDGHLSLNPEATFSRTRPTATIGAPQTVGWLQRETLRANYTLVRTRQITGGVSLSLERIDESNQAPAFGLLLSHDRYLAARLGASWSRQMPDGRGWSVAMKLNQGLGDVAAITVPDANASHVPYSRQGSSDAFTHLNASASARVLLGSYGALSLQAKGQSTFGKAVFRNEQFALEGADGVSAYIGGVTTLDEGGAARVEYYPPFPSLPRAFGLALQPYAFAAAGGGRINRPTVLEPGGFTATSLGLGTHASLARGALSLGLEYAHGFSAYAPLNHADRVNLTLGLHV